MNQFIVLMLIANGIGLLNGILLLCAARLYIKGARLNRQTTDILNSIRERRVP